MRKTRKIVIELLFCFLPLAVTGCSDNTFSCFDPEVRKFTEKELKKAFTQGEHLEIAIKNIETLRIDRDANKRTCSCQLIITNKDNGGIVRQKVAYTTQWDSKTKALKIELDEVR